MPFLLWALLLFYKQTSATSDELVCKEQTGYASVLTQGHISHHYRDSNEPLHNHKLLRVKDVEKHSLTLETGNVIFIYIHTYIYINIYS